MKFGDNPFCIVYILYQQTLKVLFPATIFHRELDLLTTISEALISVPKCMHQSVSFCKDEMTRRLVRATD